MFIFNRKKEISLDEIFVDSHFINTSRLIGLYGGGTVEIGIDSLIGGSLIIEAPSGMIFIGNNSFIGEGTSINSRASINIGNNVLIAANCILQDHDSHSINYQERKEDVNYAIKRLKGNADLKKDFSKVKTNPIIVEDDVWISNGVTILKGVKIGARSIIGTKSVVTKDVPQDSFAAGNPATVIKKLNY